MFGVSLQTDTRQSRWFLALARGRVSSFEFCVIRAEALTNAKLKTQNAKR